MSRHLRVASPLAALALFAWVAAPSPARAYKCISSSCPAWCGTVPYGLSVVSSDLGAATSESEVRRAMDDWTRVSCTSLRDTYTGRSSATVGASGDGQSEIGWVESGWRHDSNAIGVTGPQWNPSTGCINEADMELNGVDYTWTTAAGRGGNVNAYSIALHEGGHYYGLGHSTDPNATMYFAYSGGIDSLTTDDENGICALYVGSGGGTDPGSGGATPTDCTSTGCPPGQTCTGGSCVADTGDGSLCATCSSGADCGGASDYCLMYPDGSAYCGANCSSSADCPTGGACADLGGYGQCVGVDASGSPTCAGFGSSSGGTTHPAPECTTDSDCAGSMVCRSGACQAAPSPAASPLGASCASNADCSSGSCLTTSSGSFCTQTCDWLTPTSCPGGFYCSSGAIGGCDTGVCLAGSAGGVAMGGDCALDTDCASLFCDAGTCTTPCIPGGAAACTGGMACEAGSSPGCGACGTAAFVGEPCGTNDDCATRLCASAADGSTFCTARCAGDGDCPAGMSCQDIGSDSVCVPGLGSPSSPPPDDPDVPPGTDPSTDLPGGRPDGTSGSRRSGGCSVTTPGSIPALPGAPVALAGLLLGLALARRRR